MTPRFAWADLIQIAKVPEGRAAEASEWLTPRIAHLRSSRTSFRRASTQYLQRLQKLDIAAKQLRSAYEAAKKGAPIDFYNKIPGREIDRITTIITASVKELRPGRGRPKNYQPEFAIEIALSFFQIFSKVKPSRTANGPFERFCSALCDASGISEPGWDPNDLIRSILKRTLLGGEIMAEKSGI